MTKKIVSILAVMAMALSLCLPAYAADDNVLVGTWSRGEITQDVIPGFAGTKTDSAGNTTALTTSPFTGNNIITQEQIDKAASSNDWWSSDNTYYYEYVSGSYSQTSYSSSAYHFAVGQTQAYNGTSSAATLSYSQASSATSSWSVTAQISATAGLKTNYLASLTSTLGLTYASSNTTSTSTSILYSISVPAGKTGYIYAWLPGGYSYGSAQFKEYYYNMYTGTFIATGSTVTSYQGGWSPLSNSSVYVLNFTSTTA
jgi:hypothetical protein